MHWPLVCLLFVCRYRSKGNRPFHCCVQGSYWFPSCLRSVTLSGRTPFVCTLLMYTKIMEPCQYLTELHQHGNSKNDTSLKMVRIVLRSTDRQTDRQTGKTDRHLESYAGQQGEALPRFVTNQFHMHDWNKGLKKNGICRNCSKFYGKTAFLC